MIQLNFFLNYTLGHFIISFDFQLKLRILNLFSFLFNVLCEVNMTRKCISRRRQQALSLLENLQIIQTLQKTGERLDQLLVEDKYAEAIKLLLGVLRYFFI